MKNALTLGMISIGVGLLTGCVTTPGPVTVGQVGPNPDRPVGTAAEGQLEVFSATHKVRDGNHYTFDPAWTQHTDYAVLNAQGKEFEEVYNAAGHYSRDPRTITLAPGNYIVKAEAQNLGMVEVPVVIEAGRMTRIHLDDNWTPPDQTSSKDVITAPTGYPIGWSALAVNQ